MTVEADLKLYNHFKDVIDGKVGKTKNETRNQLIIADAKRNLADLISKRPNLETEKPKEDKSKDNK